MLGATAAWQENLIEIYRCIIYIERVQRPLIEALVPQQRFWGYERFLSRDRPTRAAWWEYLFPALTLAGIIILAVLRLIQLPTLALQWQLLWKDVLGLCINVSVFGVVLHSTGIAVKLRKEFFALDIAER